jgi:hypothetical protein
VKRHAAWRTREEGSIPFALLVVLVIIVTSAMLVSTLAWQARLASQEQARQDARWAADSATSLALETLSITDNLLPGMPVVEAIPTSPDQPPAWLSVPNSTTKMRWFIVESTDSNDITVIAEGRTADAFPVTQVNFISMRFDYGVRGWFAYRISSSIDAPAAEQQ